MAEPAPLPGRCRWDRSAARRRRSTLAPYAHVVYVDRTAPFAPPAQGWYPSLGIGASFFFDLAAHRCRARIARRGLDLRRRSGARAVEHSMSALSAPSHRSAHRDGGRGGAGADRQRREARGAALRKSDAWLAAGASRSGLIDFLAVRREDRRVESIAVGAVGLPNGVVELRQLVGGTGRADPLGGHLWRGADRGLAKVLRARAARHRGDHPERRDHRTGERDRSAASGRTWTSTTPIISRSARASATARTRRSRRDTPTAAFAFAASVTDETAHLWPKQTWWVATVTYGSALTMVGLARIYSNTHWSSDVSPARSSGTFTALG